MRSRNDSPGFAVTRTTSQSDSTRVPPVTELKSPPDSRMTGADSPGDRRFVDRRHTLYHVAIGRNEVARLHQKRIAGAQRGRIDARHRARALRLGQFLRDRVALGGAQRVGLRLAAAFGDRFGEVREQHREPQPQRDRQNETGRGFAVAGQRLKPQQRRQNASDIDDEHHRVLPLILRQQLHEGIDQRPLEDARGDQRALR